MTKLRKQIYELTLADLEQHPVWEFALDEEGLEGQDEATVRPVYFNLAAAPHDTRIVRANFTLADGTHLRGYLYARPSGDTSIGGIQPAIATEKGQVHFWHGIIKPTRDEMSAALMKLECSAPQLFPLKFESDDGAVSGTLSGFMFLDRQSMRERSIT